MIGSRGIQGEAPVMQAPKDQPYGMREFDVADLDGNMIFFGMELKTS